MFSVSGKNVLFVGFLFASTSPKSSSGEFAEYSSTRKSGGFKFLPSTGGSEFETLPKIETYHVSGTVNIP